MVTHSSILAGKFHGLRSLVGYSQWGCKRVRYDWVTKKQHSHQSFLRTRCIVNEQYCFEWNFFFFFPEQYVSTDLKIFRKPSCKQMCCNSDLSVPFTEHKQSRFNIILKGPMIFSMASEYRFNLVSSCISPWSACPLRFWNQTLTSL